MNSLVKPDFSSGIELNQEVSPNDYFSSVVLVQWSCAIQARSKRLSILQRPFNNWVLTFALVFETILAFLIIYSPGAASGLQLAPLSPLWYVVESNMK